MLFWFQCVWYLEKLNKNEYAKLKDNKARAFLLSSELISERYILNPDPTDTFAPTVPSGEFFIEPKGQDWLIENTRFSMTWAISIFALLVSAIALFK